MSFLKKHHGLTKRTKEKLKSGESVEVDFKLKPVGLHVDDLVAFANSEGGGEILLGVEEKKNEDGSQFGVPVGCELSDDVALQILNKAISAIPPIAVKLIAENVSFQPIIRVVVASSSSKPHCTPKGIYLRRDGSRNRPLHPPELLQVFLDAESRAFALRFENAAATISSELSMLEESLSSSVENMASQLGWVDMQLGDTESDIRQAVLYSKRTHEEAQDIGTRLRALFRQDERDDPVHKKVRSEYLKKTIDQLRDDSELLEKIKFSRSQIQLSASGKSALELTKDDLGKIFEEAYHAVTGEKLNMEKED